MSTYAIPNKHLASKPKRKSRRWNFKLTKDGKFTAMVAIVFLILFLCSMCVYALAASGVEVDAGKVPAHNSGSPITENNGTSGDVPAILVSDKESSESEKTTEQETSNPPITTTEENTAVSENTTESETEPENTITYSDDDLYYLAAAVCREAGGESEEIQLLVANVIMNRVNSDIYPDTIHEVLTQYKQYGTMWRDGITFPSWATEEVKEQCYSVAKRILEGERFCPENVLFQAEFKQGSGIYKYFDEGYYFCYYG